MWCGSVFLLPLFVQCSCSILLSFQFSVAVKNLSMTTLDDHASSYFSSVDSLDSMAQSMINETGTGGASLETSSVSDALPATVASQAPATSSTAAPATSQVPSKPMDVKERSVLPKTIVGSRLKPRRLIRPTLTQGGDVDMSEADGSNVTGKVVPSHETETQGNLFIENQPSIRKRQASSTPESHEESQVQAEPSSDVVVPVLKKSKGSDFLPEDVGAQPLPPLETADSQMAIEEPLEASKDLSQGSIEEGFDAEKEEDDIGEKAEDLKESEQADITGEVELQNDKNDGSGENSDRPAGAEMASDDRPKDQVEQDNQQVIQESESEREEGEMLPDVAEVEGVTEVPVAIGSPEIGEGLPELIGTPVVSPGRGEDETAPTAPESTEGNVNDDKNDEGDGNEETAEGSDKSNDGNDQAAAETDQTPEAGAINSEAASTSSAAEQEVHKQSTSTVTSTQVKPASPASNPTNIVNLRERARERSMQRQAGVITPSVGRGRGGRVRGRGTRGRGGRNQSSS